MAHKQRTEQKKVVNTERNLTYVGEYHSFRYTGNANDLIIDAMVSLYPGEAFHVLNQSGHEIFNSKEQ